MEVRNTETQNINSPIDLNSRLYICTKKVLQNNLEHFYKILYVYQISAFSRIIQKTSQTCQNRSKLNFFMFLLVRFYP